MAAVAVALRDPDRQPPPPRPLAVPRQGSPWVSLGGAGWASRAVTTGGAAGFQLLATPSAAQCCRWTHPQPVTPLARRILQRGGRQQSGQGQEMLVERVRHPS